MKIQAAIDHYGSASKLADALGITQSAITQWAASGEYPPDKRQLQLERITSKKLRAEPDCLPRVMGLAEKAA